jgi:zinc D-Ala-D-Ala carboxypeptidase
MNLSAHVTKAEFEQSNTATRKNIINIMDQTQTANAIKLCTKVFEPLRAAFGNNPIHISSGYRSVALNKKIGGSSTSQHCKGEAMDISIDKEMFLWIKDNLIFDQLIYEFGNDNAPQWVHVSYSKTRNRKQILKAVKVNGRTKYLPYK